MKRIILGCDGTWQNGFRQSSEDLHTNVLRIINAILPSDSGGRAGPAPAAMVQVKNYYSGVGSDRRFLRHFAGMTGAELATKVQEAYSFICLNYAPGDEICLFGFSRGAYTARIVASIIGEIGILTDKRDLKCFSTLFLAMQTAGKSSSSEADQAAARATLAPFRAKARLQVDQNANGYLVKLVGVFETVGSMGLPTDYLWKEPALTNIFGFRDTLLGDHIEFAFQAFALDEFRAGFLPTEWIQTLRGRAKGQTLKQVWFSGSHSDVGGGYDVHDLADISLAWMIAETESVIAYDLDYLRNLPNRIHAWGKQPPHDSRELRVDKLFPRKRAPPTQTHDDTREFIHASVREQLTLRPAVSQALRTNAALVPLLLPFEDLIRRAWVGGPFLVVHPARPSLATLYQNAPLTVALTPLVPIVPFLYDQAALRVANVGLRAYAFASDWIPGAQQPIDWIADTIESVRIAANEKVERASDAVFGPLFPTLT